MKSIITIGLALSIFVVYGPKVLRCEKCEHYHFENRCIEKDCECNLKDRNYIVIWPDEKPKGN